MRSRYRIHDKGAIYFVTSTIIDWLPAFQSTQDYAILLEALAHAREHKALRIYAYVLMDNHFHLVGEAPDLEKVMQSIKSYTAKRLVEAAEATRRMWLLNLYEYRKAPHKTQSRFQVWQESFHPQEMQTREVMWQKVEYVHYNPVRRGWVDAPEHWRYSSARNYLCGDPGVLEIDEPPM